jgi:hypothetical protein
VTPQREVGAVELVVALSQDEPLSVDLTMPPLTPTATNTSGSAEEEDEEELSEVLVELSEVSSEESSDDEVVLSVLVVAVLLSSDFAQEETITAMLTIRTNQEVRLFILFLYRKC